MKVRMAQVGGRPSGQQTTQPQEGIAPSVPTLVLYRDRVSMDYPAIPPKGLLCYACASKACLMPGPGLDGLSGYPVQRATYLRHRESVTHRRRGSVRE